MPLQSKQRPQRSPLWDLLFMYLDSQATKKNDAKKLASEKELIQSRSEASKSEYEAKKAFDSAYQPGEDAAKLDLERQTGDIKSKQALKDEKTRQDQMVTELSNLLASNQQEAFTGTPLGLAPLREAAPDVTEKRARNAMTNFGQQSINTVGYSRSKSLAQKGAVEAAEAQAAQEGNVLKSQIASKALLNPEVQAAMQDSVLQTALEPGERNKYLRARTTAEGQPKPAHIYNMSAGGTLYNPETGDWTQAPGFTPQEIQVPTSNLKIEGTKEVPGINISKFSQSKTNVPTPFRSGNVFNSNVPAPNTGNAPPAMQPIATWSTNGITYTKYPDGTIYKKKN